MGSRLFFNPYSYVAIIPALPLYDFSSLTFSNASATGTTGPTLAQIRTAYSSQPWTQFASNLNMTVQGNQLWTVPKSGFYEIVCGGAKGGNFATSNIGGSGLINRTNIYLAKNTILRIAVGQVGNNETARGAGGGGGSFVLYSSNNYPIIIAGGGAGHMTGDNNWIGYGRVLNRGTFQAYGQNDQAGYGATDARTGGAGYANGSSGGRGLLLQNFSDWWGPTINQGFLTNSTGISNGGFGGGGMGAGNLSGAASGGGGGSGYNGGGGGGRLFMGGGGGSFDLDTPNNNSKIHGYNTSNGFVTISTFTSGSLQAYYDFSLSTSYTGTGTTVNDLSGNSRTMTMTGSGMSFNSFPKYLAIPSSGNFLATSATTIDFASNGATFEALVFINARNGIIFSYTGNSGTPYIYAQFYNDGTNRLAFVTSSGASVTTTAYSLSSWIHLVFTLSSDSSEIYVNGSLVAVGTGGIPSNSNIPLYIGNYWSGSTTFGLNGNLSFLRVYNRVLRGYEIYMNYMSCFADGNPYGIIYPEWPPAALRSSINNLNGLIYGNGTYIVSTSSENNLVPSNGWRVFDKISGSLSTWTSSNSYSASTGTYTGSVSTTVSGTQYLGEWLEISLEKPVYAFTYSITSRNDSGFTRSPSDFIIAGSLNAGVTWVLVDTEVGVNWSSGQTQTFNITSPSSYSKYRIITTKIINGTSVSFSELKFFGYDVPYSCPLDNLSDIARSNLRAVYGLCKMFSTYAGPTVTVRRSNDNAAETFYADNFGNLTNLSGGAYNSWIGNNTGFVTQWWDQSGNGNHASQGTNANQPSLTFGSLNYVNFTENSGITRLGLANGVIPSGNTSYTISVRHGRANGNNTTPVPFVGSGTAGTANNILAVGRGDSSSRTRYGDFWWGNDQLTTAGYNENNRVTFSYGGGGGTTRTIFVNGVQQTLTGGVAQNRASTTINNFIGFGDTTNNNYLNGDLYYVAIFSSNLSTTDRQIVEQIPDPINYFPKSLIYLPLQYNVSNFGSNTYTITNNNLTFTRVAGRQCLQCSTNIANFVNVAFGSGMPRRFSISLWFNRADTTTYYTVFGITGSAFSASNVCMNFDVINGSTNCTLFTALPTQWSSITGAGLAAGSWQHAVVTMDATNINAPVVSFYLNGTLINTVTGSSYSSFDANRNIICIGKDGSNSRGFNGQIRDFSFFDFTLSGIDVSYLYNEGRNGFYQLEYPPCSLASGTTKTVAISDYNLDHYVAYGLGTYTTSSSNFLAGNPSNNAFDKSFGVRWAINNPGNYPSGVYNGTTTTPVLGSGEWLQIQLPSRIFLISYSLQDWFSGSAINNTPVDWVLGGSNDNGTSWTLLDRRRGVTWNSTLIETRVFNVYTDIPYNTYRLVFSRCGNPGNYALSINEWRLFGSPFIHQLEYPPSAMTANTTTLSGLVYVASASSFLNSTGFFAWNAFDKVVGIASPLSNGWTSNAAVYNTTTGLYNMPNLYYTEISGTQYFGEWLQLQLPFPTLITWYSITPPNASTGTTNSDRAPHTWFFIGSNDGSNWVIVDYRESQTFSSFRNRAYNISSPASYIFYRIVITRKQPSSTDGFVGIGELRLYGAPSKLQYQPTIENASFEFPAYAQPSITNGGIRGWSVGNGAAGVQNVVGAVNNGSSYIHFAQDGNQCAFIQSFGSAFSGSAYIQTIITGLNVGTMYTIKFYIANRPWTSSSNTHCRVTVGGTIGSNTGGFTIFNSSISNPIWTLVTCIPFTANSESTVLTVLNDASRGTINTDRTFLVDAFSIETGTPLQEYPPFALTSSTTTISEQPYGNGTYSVTTSGDFSGTTRWSVFDKCRGSFPYVFCSSPVNAYSGAGFTYNGSTGAPYGVTMSGTTYYGHWLRIDLPLAITINSYSITSSVGNDASCAPSTFYIGGSNDGSTWTLIDSRVNLSTWNMWEERFFNVTAGSPFSRYIILATKITNASTYFSINEWRLFTSTPEPYEHPIFPLTAGTTTFDGKTYVASASSTYLQDFPYKVFDKTESDNTSNWAANTIYYTGNGNTVWTGGFNYPIYLDDIFVYREWLQIQLPSPIILYSYTLTSGWNTIGQTPASWIIAGSNDGENWTSVHGDPITRVSFSWTSTSQSQNFALSSIPTTAYSYYRMIIWTLMGPVNGAPLLNQWRLFGV